MDNEGVIPNGPVLAWEQIVFLFAMAGRVQDYITFIKTRLAQENEKKNRIIINKRRKKKKDYFLFLFVFIYLIRPFRYLERGKGK